MSNTVVEGVPHFMANTDLPPDPPPSISAAELRRRLLASTPPPIGASGVASMDLESLAAATSAPISSAGAKLNEAISRLRMPGQYGPVDAASVAPVLPSLPEDLPTLHRRPQMGASRMGQAIDPAAVALAGYTGTSVGSVDADFSAGASRLGAMPGQLPPPDTKTSSSGSPDDQRRLKSENRELRKLLDEMKQLLQEASDNEQKFANRDQEHQKALSEKQRQIDELTSQLQGIEDQIASGAIAPAPPTPKTRTELEEWADDLERESSKISQERRQLDEERRQLHDDEESLETQMRDMEVSMARERAMLARQEMELKRLSAEIQHELEIMQRGDTALRDQLAKFQRRANDVMQGKPGTGGTATGGGRK